jgi:hypothetical protein
MVAVSTILTTQTHLVPNFIFVSEPETREHLSNGTTLERSREAVLAAARPPPPAEEMLIEDLTEEERLFAEAILDA